MIAMSENYFRVRHRVGSVDGKPRFEYHKQSLQYVQSVLDQGKIDLIDLKSIDLKLDKNSSFLETVAPPTGPEPMTNGDVSRIFPSFSSAESVLCQLWAAFSCELKRENRKESERGFMVFLWVSRYGHAQSSSIDLLCLCTVVCCPVWRMTSTSHSQHQS